MSQAFIPRRRSALIYTFIVCAFSVLLGRLFYLQVWNRDVLREHLEGSRKMVSNVEARRGNIVDTWGNLLATTRTLYNVGLDPQVFSEDDRKHLPRLAQILNKPLETIEVAINRKTYPVGKEKTIRPIRWSVLAKGVNQSTYDAVRKLGIEGVYGNQHQTRVYPAGSLAAHVLGYVNKAKVPVTGIEKFFDYYLRGQDGWRESERDGNKMELAQFREREVDSFDGLNIALTIDQTVQHIVEDEIQRLSEELDPEGISIIVSRPTTGAILAMANYPAYDPNEFYNTEKYPIAHQRNRAITDVFEPGSTFKIVPVAAALNEGIVRPDDVFQTGVARVSYRGRPLRLPSDSHRHEKLSVHDIIVKSSNRGAAQLGLMLGDKRLYKYTAGFGFGTKTGCDLGGETNGILHEPRNWDSLTITRMPIGHAVGATPMQVHSAMSVIANDGILMEPMLVKRIFDDLGNDVIRFRPKAKRRVISTEVAATVAGMLTDVVGEQGTARRAFIDHYKVAGKTGTTRKIVNGRYSNQHHVASFTGFFPSGNPVLVITVVVDEPRLKRVAYGGSVAAPAFKNIAEACIAYLGIHPERSDIPLVNQFSLLYDRSGRTSN